MGVRCANRSKGDCEEAPNTASTSAVSVTRRLNIDAVYPEPYENISTRRPRKLTSGTLNKGVPEKIVLQELGC